MAKLIYSALASLDGFNADADGSFDWAAPDAAVHAFVNDRSREIGTLLLGRRTYDILSVWDTLELGPEPDAMRDYQQLWQETDKVVFSHTLDDPGAPRTRVERDFDPNEVRALKARAARDLGIAGPQLAAHALRAGLVDELQLYLSPVVVGGGNPILPAGLALHLDLLAERRFENGTVFLRYAVADGAPQPG